MGILYCNEQKKPMLLSQNVHRNSFVHLRACVCVYYSHFYPLFFDLKTNVALQLLLTIQIVPFVSVLLLLLLLPCTWLRIAAAGMSSFYASCMLSKQLAERLFLLPNVVLNALFTRFQCGNDKVLLREGAKGR